MLDALISESNRTLTENGAPAYRSTGSDCLDFFASCGSLRHTDEDVIFDKFIRAYAEDPDTAMKLLFYARDIRGGLGERRLFRCILRRLAYRHPDSVRRNLPFIAEYGRFDDTLLLLNTPCEEDLIRYLHTQLDADRAALEAGTSCSLLAKWLPSVNTSSPKKKAQAKRLCRLLGMREREYRKILSALREHIGIVENKLRRRDYTFDYKSVPGGALLRYRNTLLRNDGERYLEFLRDVRSGRAEMHTGTLYPYEIVRAARKILFDRNHAADDFDDDLFAEFDWDPDNEQEEDPEAAAAHEEAEAAAEKEQEQRRLEYALLQEEEVRALDTTWNDLPDYCDGRNAIAVADGSGSMYWDNGVSVSPIDAAMSLALYFAEHNRGRFRNRFITFSQTPRLVRIKGDNIVDKLEYCLSFNEVANTNLFAVYRLLLRAAVKNNIPREDMPELLYVISDMEFDEATCGSPDDATVHRKAAALFEKYGYKLPSVVYWNVCSRNEQFPVTMDESGTALVSGSSPSLFRQMISQTLSPLAMMNQIIGSERYTVISA